MNLNMNKTQEEENEIIQKIRSLNEKERKKIERESRNRAKRDLKIKIKKEKEANEKEKKMKNLKTKWIEVLTTVKSTENIRNYKSIQNLCFQGIPPSIRGTIWQNLIPNNLHITLQLFNSLKKEAKQTLEKLEILNQNEINKWKQSNKLQDSNQPIESPSNQNKPHKANGNHKKNNSLDQGIGDKTSIVFGKEDSITLISLDLPRTFPGLKLFKENGPIYGFLHDLLGAYTRYRPDLGYVQGMSYLAAMFLINMDPFPAFCALSNTLNSELMINFYNVNMRFINQRILVFDKFLQKFEKEIFNHLRSLEITSELFLIDWFMTIFSNVLPLDITSRVWDCYFFFGEPFLYRTGIAIIRLLKNNLLNHIFDDCVKCLLSGFQSISEDDLFQEISKIKISEKKLDKIIKLTIVPEEENSNQDDSEK